MRTPAPPPWNLERYDIRTFGVLTALALVYFATAKFGLLFAFSSLQVTAVWAPSGIAVAALLLFGHRPWPAIVIGTFAANVTHIHTAVTAAGIAVGNAVGPLVAVWALRRIDFDPTLARVRDALALVGVGALGMSLCATNGVTFMALAGIFPWRHYFDAWWIWWIGDTMGVVVMAPLILAWAADWRIPFSKSRMFEFAALCTSMLALALFVLDDPRVAQYKYMLFSSVVWAAMRFGQRGTSVLVVLLAGLAVWGAARGRWPFIEASLDQRLLGFTLFVGSIAVTGLLLSAVVTERERARTSLQRTNDELAAAESRLRTVITNAPLAIWSTDARGYYTFIAGAVLGKVGVTGEQLIGVHYDAFTHDQTVDDAMKLALEGTPGHYIVTYGSIISETHVEPLYDERGEVAGVIGVSIDVTERMHAEQEKQRLAERMQHAQKLESLGVLAGGIAHDFNNLLTPIVGNADLALMVTDDPNIREHLGQIQSAACRAADLTRQMLAYAGKRPMRVTSLNLSRAVEEMTRLLRASVSKKAKLSYRFVADLPPIEADRAQVSQVVMNLITNASDALGDQSGSIIVTTGVTDVDEHTLRDCIFDDGVAPGPFAYLEVTDTGAGMDASTIARMFDPFFTTKFAGRGLGLSAVRGIMRGHNGTLYVTSQPNRGTTMRALFPIKPSVTEPMPLPQPRDTSWRGHGTILLVDDEPSVREVSGGILEALGFTVIAAADGAAAMSAYVQSRERIRAVLLDMAMPVMNGEETFDALERVDPDVKVVLCSGYAEEDTMARFAGRGLAGFLPKPFAPYDLITLLRRILDE